MSKIMHMRGFLTSSHGVSRLAACSIGVACAAVVTLAPAAPAAAEDAVAGSTRSLPLVPLSRERVGGVAPQQGLYRADLDRFALVGVVWDDPDAELHGQVQVRTRSAATGEWSGWQDVETHNADHGADHGTAERSSRRVRGATAPLWVGGADGVDVRVRAESGSGAAGQGGADGAGRTGGAGRAGVGGGGTGETRSALPSGLRVELVDPGDEPEKDDGSGGEAEAGTGDAAGGAAGESLPQDTPAGEPLTALDTEAAIAASAANSDISVFGATAIPALSQRDTELELARLEGAARVKPYIGPRPRIVTRRGWGADESLRERGFVYTKKVKAAFVHHTASGNKYTCAQAPSVIRSIYRYHVKSMGWRDVGYNFLVDKCGTIYEGRAGGVTKAVLGAHTLGFNTNSMGIAVIGTYSSTKPSSAAVKAVAQLTAWKLGLFGANPKGKTYLTSGGGNLYAKGKNVRLNVISGHRDGFATECPGKRIYAKLGTVRSTAARYQGR